jgi:hypothetical protein
MQPQNLEEYKLIRKELSELKNCVTEYVGFLFGGSSIALGLLGFLYKNAAPSHAAATPPQVAGAATPEMPAASLPQIPGSDVAPMPGAGPVQIPDHDQTQIVVHSVSQIIDPNSSQIIAYLSLVFAILVTLIAAILVYKFKSHNRHVAYCRVISQERWLHRPDELQSGSLFGWEWCLTILYEEQYSDEVKANINRRIDHLLNNKFPGNIYVSGVYFGHKKWEREVWDSFVFFGGLRHSFYSLDKILSHFLDWLRTKFTKRQNEIDRSRIHQSIFNLSQQILDFVSSKRRKIVSTSWIFPRPTILSVFLITLVFIAVSFINTLLADDNLLWAAFVLTLGYQMYMWWNLFRQFYHILDREGFDTIDAYQWRFIPIREAYLARLGVTVDWRALHPVGLREAA